MLPRPRLFHLTVPPPRNPVQFGPQRPDNKFTIELRMLFELRRTIDLATTLDEAWGFFSDPRNLTRITPPALGLRITTPPSARMYPGEIIAYTVTPLLGIPMVWVTEITHVEEPHRFVDEQRHGPYKMWHHQHLFEEIAGGVRAVDLVHYILPGGPLGGILNRLVVAPQLDEIFAYRAEVLTRHFGPVNQSV